MDNQEGTNYSANLSNSPDLNTPVDPTPTNRLRKSRIPNNVKLSLLIFTLTSALVLAFTPHLSSKSASSPAFWMFLVSGFIVIALTALLFWVLSKLNLGFGKTAIVMAFGYNAVIAIIKFVISPRALYLSNQHNPFSAGGVNLDPNTILYYILTALLILLLYIFAFRLIYRHFHRRIMAATGFPLPRRKLRPKRIGMFILIAFGIVVLGGGILLLPLIVVGSELSYLGYIFGSLGIPLAIAITLGIILAYKSFAAVEKQVLVTGNTALLASFFWVGLSLIFLYHILWIVFMLTLVHIWPFNTYSPK